MFGNEQSAAIEQLRMALRGLSQIASGEMLEGEPPIEIERPNMAALFELIEVRLGELVGAEAVRTVWLDPDLVPGEGR